MKMETSSMVEELRERLSKKQYESPDSMVKSKIKALAHNIRAIDLVTLAIEEEDRDTLIWLLSALVTHPAPGNRKIIGNAIGQAIQTEEEAKALVAAYDPYGTRGLSSELQRGLIIAAKGFKET